METREITETTKGMEVLPETREIDRIETELNRTKEETQTKIQGETNRHEETTEIKCIETREIEKIEERLHDKDGVKDEHTHGSSGGQRGRAGRMSRDPVQAAG